MNAHPFVIRRQVSGYSGTERWVVVKNPGRRRVSTEPLSREQAQDQADRLNIGSMVKDYDMDPRPYDVRHAEAASAYRAGT